MTITIQFDGTEGDLLPLFCAATQRPANSDVTPEDWAVQKLDAWMRKQAATAMVAAATEPARKAYADAITAAVAQAKTAMSVQPPKPPKLL